MAKKFKENTLRPWPGIELSMDQPTMQIDAGRVTDEKWRYVDKQSHLHAYVKGDDPYPTLIEVEDETYWCAMCSEEHTDSHLECKVCAEHIEPGTTYKGPTIIPAGPVEITATVTRGGETITMWLKPEDQEALMALPAAHLFALAEEEPERIMERRYESP